MRFFCARAPRFGAHGDPPEVQMDCCGAVVCAVTRSSGGSGKVLASRSRHSKQETMEMHLQPLANSCFVSGDPFAEGVRVVSQLVRNAAMEIVRYDVLESHAANFAPEGFVACRWVHLFKARRGD